jgi:hypothetical protein
LRADSGCSCPGFVPDNFILELVDHHPQRGQLSPTPKGALAAARTLGRSPSWQPPSRPRHRPHFSMVASCLLRSRLDLSDTLAGPALVLARAVPPAEPLPPPQQPRVPSRARS